MSRLHYYINFNEDVINKTLFLNEDFQNKINGNDRSLSLKSSASLGGKNITKVADSKSKKASSQCRLSNGTFSSKK
jgi:hypothetical protein